MDITKDDLQKKLDEYKNMKSFHQAQAVLFDGAIQDVQVWIDKLNEVKPEVTDATPTSS